MALSEEPVAVRETLKNLQKQIQEKETFINAISSIKALLINHYPHASPSLRNSFYSTICDVERALQTKYTDPDFWLAGKELFEEAERHVIDTCERDYLKTCISMASQHLDITNVAVPPRGTLEVAQELLGITNVAVERYSERLRDANHSLERASVLMEEMLNAMQEVSGFRRLMDSVEAAMQNLGSTRPMRQPPASKEVIEKLPVVTLSKEMMDCLGSDVQCAVCRDSLCIDDKVQELPCKHLFHQLCLKPWMEMNNSCPVCRHELPTDNAAYESWKERERVAKMNETTSQTL